MTLKYSNQRKYESVRAKRIASAHKRNMWIKWYWFSHTENKVISFDGPSQNYNSYFALVIQIEHIFLYHTQPLLIFIFISMPCIVISVASSFCCCCFYFIVHSDAYAICEIDEQKSNIREWKRFQWQVQTCATLQFIG